MAQQQSPWLEGAYGWSFGEGGWNTGMDQNLLKFSFMFDRNVDSVVASLPAAVNGQAHYLTTDNRLYFAVGTTYFSTPAPKWFEFKVRSTGVTYQFNGASANLIDSPAQLDTRLDAVELTVASLGTAAFENIEFFSTQAELDIVEADAQAYTDTLRSDLSGTADPLKNAGQIGFNPALAYGVGTVGKALKEVAPIIPYIESFGAVGDGIADDTGAFALAAVELAVQLNPGKTYRLTAPTNITSNNGFTLYGNGAKIVYDYEQSGSPSYIESCFYVTDSDDVTFKDTIIQYTGTFNFGDYGGFISGIHVESSDRFLTERCEIYGFNRAGINIATLTGGSAYCDAPMISKCYLHHNRVSGVLFGNTSAGTVSECQLTFNGDVSSAGTGYGFASWSSNIPHDTLLTNNQANDNYRKGLDFHSGINGVVSGNVCARNRVYGIFVFGVTGGWSIVGNQVSEMTWANEFPTVAPYGIRVGDLQGQGLSGDATVYTVTGNVISDMNKTAGEMFPFGESLVGNTYGTLILADNVIDVGTVSQLYNSASTAKDVAGNYFDVSITNNTFKAASCTSTAQPIAIRSGNNRKKVFSNNVVEIAAVTGTSGVFTYDVTTQTNRSLIATGNDITAPASAWSAVYDPINVKRVTNEVSVNNVVNGIGWRDWNGVAFDFLANAAPTTNFWSQGSKTWANNAAASGFVGWYCTVAGTPGTWKTFGAISA